MNDAIAKSLYQLTGNGNMDEVSVNQLKQLRDEHPYFSVGQFLLAKKMKTDNDSQFLDQARQTAVYFKNRHWLNFQLQDSIPDWFAVTTNNEEATASDDIASTEAIHIEPPAATAEAEANFDLQHQLTEEQFELAELAQAEETEQESTPEIAAMEVEALESITETSIDAASVIEAPNNEEPEINEPTADLQLTNAVNEVSEFQPYQPEEKTTEAEEALDEPIESETDFTPIHIPNLAEAAQVLEKQVEDEDLDKLISNEPYHTVDYFASQGIKPTLDDNPQDKLGRQVKRFTEWIKHMKQVGSEDALQQINDPVLESTIQNIANTSNSSREIVTETMAEVLIKQGKIDKAIQLYIKLSFLNPDKSAFFASKIQQLKGIAQ